MPSRRCLSFLPARPLLDGEDWGVNSLGFESEASLLAAGSGGVRRFDIETGKSEWIWKMDKEMRAGMALSADGRRLLAVAWPSDPERTEDHPVVLFDLAEGRETPITSHGNRVKAVALDRDGTDHRHRRRPGSDTGWLGRWFRASSAFRA